MKKAVKSPPHFHPKEKQHNNRVKNILKASKENPNEI